MEILTENYRQERKTLPQTAAKFKYSDQKRNENRPIREELERNIQTQFQLQKKWEDAENDNSESQYKNSELNSAWER